MLNTTLIFDNAIAFWINYWKGKIEVPFSDFAEELYYSVFVPFPESPEDDFRYLCLKAICTDNLEGQDPPVTLLRFSLILKWFGDLKNNNSNIIDNIYHIVEKKWFHGDISREEANDLLTKKKRKAGTFLVRLSISDPIESPFTISKLTKGGKVVHQRIYRKYIEDGTERWSILIPEKK